MIVAFHGRAKLRLRSQPCALKLAVQMPGLPKRRRKSDLHVVDWPTVAVATAVVVLDTHKVKIRACNRAYYQSRIKPEGRKDVLSVLI